MYLISDSYVRKRMLLFFFLFKRDYFSSPLSKEPGDVVRLDARKSFLLARISFCGYEHSFSCGKWFSECRGNCSLSSGDVNAFSPII